MRIKYYSREEAQSIFREPDEYALNLPLSNLQKVSPRDPTLDGYQKVFLDSFIDVSGRARENFNRYAQALARLNFEVGVVATNGRHLLDIAQTRKHCILAPHGWLSQRIFIHEVYHVLSRTHKELTPLLAGNWGFRKVKPVDIQSPGFLLNPDAVVSEYVIDVIVSGTGEVVTVMPFMVNGLRTRLKVHEEERYLETYETNYSSLIHHTSYHSHPEEICAEYFAASVLRRDSDNGKKCDMQLREFTRKLLEFLRSNGLYLGSCEATRKAS